MVARHGWLLLVASALGACPDSPAFVTSDDSDAQADASETIDPGDTGDAAPIEETTDTASDTGVATDASDVDDANDATGDAVEVIEQPGCGLGCGPLAHCVDRTCVCDNAACDGMLDGSAVVGLSLTLDAAEQPALAIARFSPQKEIGVARWGLAGWDYETPVVLWPNADAFNLTLDDAGVLSLLHVVAPSSLAVAQPLNEGWFDDVTDYGECISPSMQLDPVKKTLAVLCVDIGSGTINIFDYVAGDSSFTNRNVDPLVIGKTASYFRWGFAPTGLIWATWLAPSVDDEPRSLELAYLSSDVWNHDSAGAHDGVSSVALAIDSLSNPHVIFGHRDGGEAYVSHVYYKNAIEVVTDRLVSKTTGRQFASHVDATPGPDGSISVAYDDDVRVVWFEVKDTIKGEPEVLQLGTAPTHVRIVANSGGRPFATVIEDDQLRMWLPRGPYGTDP